MDAPDRQVQLDVTILGREYRVACGAGEREALLKAVAHLDSRMREIRDAGKVAGMDRIAVMAALNIAHDLLRERAQSSTRKVASAQAGAESPIDAPSAQRRIRNMHAAIDQTLAAQDKLF